MTITYIIIGVTVLVSLFSLNKIELFDRLKFNAYDVKHSNQWYRFFTYGFLHAGWLHLFINMLVLYSFGGIVEAYFKFFFPLKYILYYLLLYIGGLLLSIIPAFGKNKNDVFYNAVGASGAIAAVLFSSIILYPTGKIFFFFIPIGIPSPIFGVLYVAYEYYMSKKAKDNIGHDAHLWGAIFGIVFTIAIKPQFAISFLQQIGFHF
jgi:membrane associated rhomboid family serine protease